MGGTKQAYFNGERKDKDSLSVITVGVIYGKNKNVMQTTLFFQKLKKKQVSIHLHCVVS